MKSKTIILSQNEQKGRGILTIFQEENLLQCRLRLYNTPKLSRYCKIGVFHNNEVFSANLLEKSGVYTSSIVGDFNIDQDFYTAIVDTQNNNNVILAGGTYAGFFFNDNSVFEKQINEIEEVNPNTNLYDYPTQESKQTIKNDEIKIENKQCETECDKCTNCKYKEFFYSNKTNIIENQEILPKQIQPQENTQNIIASSNIENEKKETKTILENLIPQFQYVFENYEADETLNNLISNSKFVKIAENHQQYSIGAIYENDEMKFICYAVLCEYNSPVPQELGEHYQWLPLDKEDPLSEGYYVVFQDTQDLKIVEM